MPLPAPRSLQVLLALAASLGSLAPHAQAQSYHQVWEWSQAPLVPPAPPPGADYVQVCCGAQELLALRSDGWIVGMGYYTDCQEELVPPLPPGLTYVYAAAGGCHSVAILSNGQIVGWGDTSHGEGAAPALPSGVSYVEAAAGLNFSIALRSDGRVAAFGDNSYGQCDVPGLPPGMTYVHVNANWYSCAAVRSDGNIVVWGGIFGSMANVPALPPGVQYVKVSAGWDYFLALRSDGVAVGWGNDFWGQSSVPNLPAGMTYVDIEASSFHSLALRSDGVLLAFGSNNYHQCDVPALPIQSRFSKLTTGNMGFFSAVIVESDVFASFCEPGSAGTQACPCTNLPAGAMRGCDNSAATGGAWLASYGGPSLGNDSVRFATGGEPTTALSVLLQGSTSASGGITFGQGVRCVSGQLLRLYSAFAAGGSVHLPYSGSVSARSSLLGDTIAPGSHRYYQVYYRDPVVLGGCASTATFNVTQANDVTWYP